MTRGCDELTVFCYSVKDAVSALKMEIEWDNKRSLNMQDVKVETSKNRTAESPCSSQDDLDDSFGTGIHYVKKLKLCFLGQMSGTDADNMKKELKRNIHHLVHEGLEYLALSVKNITDITGTLPSDMQRVNLQIIYSENPTQPEWENFCKVLTTIEVDSLYVVHTSSEDPIDLDYLFHFLTNNEVNLQVKSILVLYHGKVSADRVMTLLSKSLQYQIKSVRLTIFEIRSVTTLKSLLHSTNIQECSYETGQGFQEALAEKECKEILENSGIGRCSCSPSLCSLLRNILNRVSDFNKPLYWPCLKRVEDVEYLATDIFPIIQGKSEATANGIEFCVGIKDDVLKKRMFELIGNTKGIFHYEPDESSLQLLFLPATGRYVREHCRYHVYNR